MPATQRRTQTALIDRLIAQPYRFDFFQAVRLLDLSIRRGAGEHGQTLDGVLRFKNSVSLSFPPSQIEAISVSVDTTQATDANRHDPHRIGHLHLTPAFMGFLGANGVLPYDYTATIAVQITVNKNEAGRAFFDNFSHRSMLLFYRAWVKCRIEYRNVDERDSFLGVQLSLAGKSASAAHNAARSAPAGGGRGAKLPAEVVAHYAALIRHRPMQADMLAGALSEYFSVPVRCQPLVGAWAGIAEQNRSALGVRNHVLGGGLMLGERYWRRGAIVRLWLGPLKRNDFDRFLAGGSAVEAVKAMLALFAIPTVAFEVRPILRAADIGPATLDGRTRIGHGAILITAPPTPQRPDHASAGYRITFSPE